MSNRVKVGVLISGNGTNLQALIDAANSTTYPAEISLVISNRADAKGLKRARDAGIKTEIIEHEKYDTRESFDEELSLTLHQHHCEIICLAGFMRILSIGFVNNWKNKILNIHPSLLPSFPGTKVHSQAISAGVRISGCTLHYVTNKLDAGPIIAQAAVPVHGSDTPQELAERILKQEHKLYPAGLAIVANRLANTSVTAPEEISTTKEHVLINF